MSLATFNENHKQFLDTVYDRINEKFNTDKGKDLTDCLIEISEPFLSESVIKEFLTDLVIRRLDLACEKLNLTTIEEFTPEAIGFTTTFAKVFHHTMNGIKVPLY